MNFSVVRLSAICLFSIIKTAQPHNNIKNLNIGTSKRKS